MKRTTMIMAAMLLLLLSSSNTWALSSTKGMPEMVREYIRQYDIDPLDTMDEDDYLHLRDTIKMSRENIARKEHNSVNAIDYILDDRFSRNNETFAKGFWSHTYLGAGLGLDFIVPQSDNYRLKQISQLSLSIGKELNKFHTLRLTLGGGWGYLESKEHWLMRGSARLDYMYNLSTHFAGYNPSRFIEFQFVTGLGAHLTKMANSEMQFVPEFRVGAQAKIFAGLRSYINIEPYIGISGDQIDMSNKLNWHKYDLTYGFNMNYVYFLEDHLSPQSKLRLLQKRLDNQRMVNATTVETWRTPWFVQASTGPVITSPCTDYGFVSKYGNETLKEIGMFETLGSEITMGFGRWLSPAIGLRFSVASRSTMWRQGEVAPSLTTNGMAGYTNTSHSYYGSGRIDGLFNPMGLSRKFSWDAPFGFYILAGAEFGYITKYQSISTLRARSESYGAGINLWAKLTDDLHIYIEPRYAYSVYVIPYVNVPWRVKYTDNTVAVNVGLTMNIRSEKFHEFNEFDNVQNYLHKEISGVRLGLTGGMTILQQQFDDYGGGGIDWNAAFSAEYRFNYLHSVRAVGQFFNFKKNDILNFKDSYTLSDGKKYTTNRNGMWNTNSMMVVASLDYQVSLTNLLSGRLLKRRFELEAFTGPSLGMILNRTATISPDERLKDGHSAEPNFSDLKKKFNWGWNAGLKLTMPIAKGFSVVAVPTLYMLDRPELPGIHTVGIGEFRLFETIDIGVQYKLGSLKRNPNKLRIAKARRDKSWTDKQAKRISKNKIKADERSKKRHQKHEDELKKRKQAFQDRVKKERERREKENKKDE